MQRLKLNFASLLLCGCIFASGACGIILEYIQASIASMILGNSFEQWAVVIGLMLFWMGLASLLQVHIKKKYLIYMFIAVETGLALVGGFSPTLTYYSYSLTSHYILVLYFFVSFIGIMIGLEIPIIIRINNDYTKELKTNVGNILSADYLGSLLGALIFVYIILRFFPITKAAFLTALINFLLAFVTYVYFYSKKLIKSKIPAVIMLLTIVFISYGYAKSDQWNIKIQQPLYDDPVIHTQTTQYQHIVMTHYKPLNETRLFLNGNLQLCSLDEARYHEPLVHPAMNLVPQRKKILILGGGDGCALREVLKYKDVEQVLLVDLDPKMTQLAMEHPQLIKINNNAFMDARVIKQNLDGIAPGDVKEIFMEKEPFTKNKQKETVKVADVNIMNVDADKFLEKIPGFWDVIIVDMPDPSSPELTKLYSKVFYTKAKRHLSMNGIMVVQATSPYFAKESFLCIGRTIESAGFSILPFHENVPSFGDWGWYIAWQPGIKKSQIFNKIDKIKIPVKTLFLTEEVFKAELKFGKNLLKSDRNDINTIINPILLSIYTHECWQY
ncbi:MAG: polyamine aminopropyltransferase [Desulfobacteraceae bacterium]|nr:polyamine aminopropyltransferase [Desulfobacteraceae bacterium]